MPVRVVSGKNCLFENKEELLKLGESCLIVTGGSSAKKCGALDDAEKVLNDLNIKYEIFDEITQNPYTGDCHRAGERAREMKADFIFGIGGGSPLDAAKAVAIYASNENLRPSDIYAMKHKNKPLPTVLIGTTSGTGSEVTGVSVLTDSDTGLKKSISGAVCYASVAFCDWKYTCTMPHSVTVSTSLDAFSHAAEAYLSDASNDLSDIYCEKTFSMLGGAFRFFQTGKMPDDEMRENLYIASLIAGLALNITGTCFPHTMGYVLTEDFDVPHGRACAAFLPEFIEISSSVLPEKAEKMCRLCGFEKRELCAVLTELADVNVKISDEQLAACRIRWSSPVKNFSRTPGEFTGDTAVEILKKYK